MVHLSTSQFRTASEIKELIRGHTETLAAIIRWITEFAVTDRRVIYKCGFISRHTVEMNMDKVKSVDVDQSLLGRLLNYGTIHVLGTGEGIESLRRIAAPLALRNAITAK